MHNRLQDTSKKIPLLSFLFVSLLLTFNTFAQDTYVTGYYPSQETYLAPPLASESNGQKWNDYESSISHIYHYNPYVRDADSDAEVHSFDRDEPDDGLVGNFEPSQYINTYLFLHSKPTSSTIYTDAFDDLWKTIQPLR